MQESVKKEISRIYTAESGKVLASLVRILGDLDLAEEALQTAFSVALEKWPKQGIPGNPCSWLISTGKFKGIDAIRRRKRGRELLSEHGLDHPEIRVKDQVWEKFVIEDDQLRLIFFCCHPSLSLESRIALSLRDVCGMNTEEIARAYLVSAETVKKRITRAKAVIREGRIPYEIPARSEITQRMDAVLHVIYLIYNEGYDAGSGERHIRKELTEKALFLCRQLVDLIATSESLGLLALLLFHESRRPARLTGAGDIIRLEDQDRTLWDREQIREGMKLLGQAVMSGRLGPYTLQAAIASVHSAAGSVKSTRWDLIVSYYDMLATLTPSPVVDLNRAIAVGMAQGPRAGLDIINRLIRGEQLDSYPYLYSAKAEFSRKLGLKDDAVTAYARAIELSQQEPERRFLKQQIAAIQKK